MKMINYIKNWFFELIEDAIGSKAMKKFNEEEINKSESQNEAKDEKLLEQ